LNQYLHLYQGKGYKKRDKGCGKGHGTRRDVKKKKRKQWGRQRYEWSRGGTDHRNEENEGKDKVKASTKTEMQE